MQVKAQDFFRMTRDLMALISQEDTNNSLFNVILLVNLLRVILLPCLCWRVGGGLPESGTMRRVNVNPQRVAGDPVHKPAPSIGTFDWHRRQRSRHKRTFQNFLLLVLVCSRPKHVNVCRASSRAQHSFVHVHSDHFADDLWHTALLTCLLMLCFAGIGTWRFGNTMEVGKEKIRLFVPFPPAPACCLLSRAQFF